MATLQKFKLLATQCAVVAGSPTRSPSASPVIHLRRRKTLRMLLNRTDRRFSRRNDSPSEMDSDPNPTSRNNNNNNNKNNNKNGSKEVRVRHKLKDLFVSSPPIEDRVSDSRFNRQEDDVGFSPATGSAGGSGGGGGGGGNGFAARRGGGIGPFRPITASFRYRLLRRPWRPVLVTIPE
ncbi:uncharacterized protein LOC126713859 [Quercus robur]|uniref:uncharacterized protein LOC126713859 n=1 Tax=Quercus robur TaxID=38942 RepID=UPI0021626564|nr:uncharacterized protein LOC126713859 [Quercus robur]